MSRWWVVLCAILILAGTALCVAAPEANDRAETKGTRQTSDSAESDASTRSALDKQADDAPEEDIADEADPDEWLTLPRLVQLADRYNPILRRDLARIQSAEGDALQAGLYPNPRFDTNNPEVFSGRNTALNAGFMQEIVTKRKNRLDRAAATKIVDQARFSYTQDRFALLTSIRQQFYQTLAAQKRVDVYRALLEITEKSVRIVQKLESEVGEVPETDVLLLTIDSERVQADYSNAIAMLEGERKQLSVIVGLPFIVSHDVIGTLQKTPPVYDEARLQEYVTTNSTFLNIAKLEVDRNKLLLKRAEAQATPNITIGPAYQWGTAQGNNQFWFNIQFPIPTTDRNQGGIRAARASIRDATENLTVIQLELLKQVADARSRHLAALARAEKYKRDIIPQTRRVLRLAQSGWQNGLEPFSKYLQAQRTVVETNAAYVDILETVWTTAAELAGLLQIEQFP